jgi:hypothetical protein
LIAVCQDHFGAFLVESFCQSHADTAGGTSHNSYFSSKFHACDVTHSVTIL